MAIKILLLKDVDKLGRAGEIVTARPGYIRNYLIPQAFAEIATKQALRKQARIQEERRQQAIRDQAEAKTIAEALQSISVSTIVKVDHEGHMYGSVSALDIVHLVKEQANIDIERRSVALKHPIKQVGKYTIPIKLKEGVTAEVSIEVIAEGSEQVIVQEQS